MNPLTNNWMFFPSLIGLRFAPSSQHTMDSLLLATGFSERKSRQASIVVTDLVMQTGSPHDVPAPAVPFRPVRPIPTDVPVPEPFDVPVPEPRDVPPPESHDVPPPQPEKLPVKRPPRPKHERNPRSVP